MAVWDYETDYYHVYATDGLLDGAMPAWTATMPQSPEADRIFSEITRLLNELETLAARGD